jgi:hypothetical protein
VGFVGLAAWVWLIVRAAQRLKAAARAAERTSDEWLFAGLLASIVSFAVGMLTFDAFGFTQVTFIFWILLGLSAALLRISTARPMSSAPASSYGNAQRLP